MKVYVGLLEVISDQAYIVAVSEDPDTVARELADHWDEDDLDKEVLEELLSSGSYQDDYAVASIIPKDLI